MDIRDLIKPESVANPRAENPSPPLNRAQAAPVRPSLKSSVTSPALPIPHQVLPSPSDSSKFSQGRPAIASSQAAFYTQPALQPLPNLQRLQTPAHQQAQSQQRPSHWSSSFTPIKRASPPDDSRSGPPPKRQSKWNPEEDKKIIAFRGQGMKWSEISARLYPRTEIGCRLHYQNYLEKRSDWDEEKKNKLARVYERVKEDMWKLVANEMKIPWRSAEGMHWIMGETEMARRANVTPFSNTIHPSSTSGATATVYSNATNIGNGHPRTPLYHDNSNTMVFETEQLATLKPSPGTNMIDGPVSTFAVGGLGLPRESAASESNIKAFVKPYTNQPSLGQKQQLRPQDIDEDLVPLSPRSDRAMRDISPRTYQALREKRARLPSVTEMECMVPVTSSAPFTEIDGRIRRASDGSSHSDQCYEKSAGGRAEDGKL